MKQFEDNFTRILGFPRESPKMSNLSLNFWYEHIYIVQFSRIFFPVTFISRKIWQLIIDEITNFYSKLIFKWNKIYIFVFNLNKQATNMCQGVYTLIATSS